MNETFTQGLRAGLEAPGQAYQTARDRMHPSGADPNWYKKRMDAAAKDPSHPEHADPRELSTMAGAMTGMAPVTPLVPAAVAAGTAVGAGKRLAGGLRNMFKPKTSIPKTQAQIPTTPTPPTTPISSNPYERWRAHGKVNETKIPSCIARSGPSPKYGL